MEGYTETERILLILGYYADDTAKIIQVESYIKAANQFMKNAGVSEESLNTDLAADVRLRWAEVRDEGNAPDLAGKDRIIVSLIEQLRGLKS